MRIHVRQCQMTHEVRTFLERFGFRTHAPVDGVVEIRPPDGTPTFVARLELNAYLTLWRAVNEPYEAVVRD